MSSPNTDKYLCKFCRFSASSNEDLNIHVLNRHKMYKCSICHQKFFNLGQIRAHVKEVHLVKWTCQICDRSFANEAQYVNHTKMHVAPDKPLAKVDEKQKTSSELPTVDNNKSTTLNPVQAAAEIYMCLFCDFTTFNQDELDSHIRNHAVIEVFKCEICQTYFENKTLLEEHAKNHKEIFYQCGICNMKSTSKKQVKRHLNEEHGLFELSKKQKC